jgi:hypothetical protein
VALFLLADLPEALEPKYLQIEERACEMKQVFRFLLISLAVTAIANSTRATLITFDDQGFANLQACTTQYAPQGVVFAGVADDGSAVSVDVSDSTTFGDVNPYSTPFSLSNFYNNNSGLRAHILRIIFLGPVSNVSFEYNPAGGEGSSTLFDVYNASSSLIDSFSDSSATGAGVWYLESVNMTGISEVDIVNPSSGWGHYIDNLSFTPSSVPDGSSTVMLLGLALSSLALIRRKLA